MIYGDNIRCVLLFARKYRRRYIDSEKLEYFVIASAAEKPVKIVIKGLPIDTSCDEIKEEYRVDKVHQF